MKRIDERLSEYLDEKTLDVFAKHQVAIARKTLKMSDAGAKIMGGMNKEEARAVLKKYGLKEEVLTEGLGPIFLKQEGPNFTKIYVSGKTLWFSYETLVAFSDGSKTYATSEKFSNTTSRQMGTIDVDVWLGDDDFLTLARKKL